MAKTMSSQIEGMASKFIAGTDAASALPALEKMWKNGMCFSVDLLGEACVSDEEARLYRQKYLDLVENLPKRVATWPAKLVLESDHLGPVPRTNVSIKISSLSARVDPIDTEGSIRTLMAEIMPILESAKKHGVLVNFDMEQFALKDLTLELFKRTCAVPPTMHAAWSIGPNAPGAWSLFGWSKAHTGITKRSTLSNRDGPFRCGAASATPTHASNASRSTSLRTRPASAAKAA